MHAREKLATSSGSSTRRPASHKTPESNSKAKRKAKTAKSDEPRRSPHPEKKSDHLTASTSLEPTHALINRRATSKSKLHCTLYELLTDNAALPYFIQFMENEGNATIVQFWLAAESFFVTATERLKVYQGSPANQQRGIRANARTVAGNDDRRQLLGLSSVALATTDRLGRERRVSERRREAVLQAKRHNIGLAQRQQSESARADALNVYETYLSLEARNPVLLGNNLRQQVESSICQSDGFIDPACFRQAQDQVFDLIHKKYYQDFLSSQYMCRYQIDVLTGGKFSLRDVLYHETMLGYFMQFLERESDTGFLEFWLTAEHVQEQLLDQIKVGTYNADEAVSDCILYDKYFSLQATQPVGFDDRVRFEVENNICREGGPLPTCFSSSQKIAYNRMEVGRISYCYRISIRKQHERLFFSS
ncbi:A-kinase anchor protein 10, mitochondrial-like [Oscarella lobularis]|uniref:A-kinase anchor protein 10, mitochondrial-like n=1 Tax=Oscarella lobularis TaxID=121494 RepID=UPI0033133C69